MNTSGATLNNKALWQKLHASGTEQEFFFNWLVIQCSMLHSVHAAAVYLVPQVNSPLSPIVSWPETFQPSGRFNETAQRVALEGKCIASLVTETGKSETDANRIFLLACPFPLENKDQGTVVFQLQIGSDRELQNAMHQIQWGTIWLENLVRDKRLRDAAKPYELLNKRLMTIFDILAAVLEESRYTAAATVAVTELATRIDCDRVSLGFSRKSLTTVVAVSHSAKFARHMKLVTSIGAAMDESIDQGATVLYPPAADQKEMICRCHEVLQDVHGSRAILTVPFLDADGEGYGALTFERATNKPFDSNTVILCESASALLGPILNEKKLNALPLYSKAANHFAEKIYRLFGPGYPALKFVSCCIAAVLLFLSVVNGDYRVAAQSVLEGTVQRSVIAPFDGYLYEAPARAGDIVSRNQILAGLDKRDLLLQRLKWASQQKQLVLESNKALAKNEIAEANIIREQMSQAESELLLLDEQLERASIRAPFDGIIITGDWSQAIGAPIERGQTLFQIAPLDSYRVMLEVSEGDIDQVAVGQEGELVLNAIPGNPFAFTVEKITPVTTTREGRTFFLVEGGILAESDKLRPGMQGYGKIYIARRKLIWIWTHDMIDWVRLRVWSKIF
ncbi:MAG: HlyD family efflux transporter periplasmic adaptor subunit [Desulfobulbales bacterium]|nr:HlyD family efflux transporter periplasmic adaptor subunit [Desulfobulbales bacterium]